jgi:alkylated DNA repair dioxygenase AlkB
MSIDTQGDLFPAPAQSPPAQSPPAPSAPATPPGFRYWPDVVTPDEAAALVAELEALPFKPFDFHGYRANRRIVSFGLRYDYGKRAVEAADPIPAFLEPIRAGIAELAGLEPEAFSQSLINEYRPGAGIGWHRDKPQFGVVAGVSLVSPCVLRLRRRAGARWERASAPLAPRSAYLLSGPAREAWEHSISPGEALRYSITLRTLTAGGATPT